MPSNKDEHVKKIFEEANEKANKFCALRILFENFLIEDIIEKMIMNDSLKIEINFYDKNDEEIKNIKIDIDLGD